jgi:hypothetical protein
MTNQLQPVAKPGTEITRFNALQHGILSEYTVLPWENSEDYQALMQSLANEHAPQGPTEEHLVEELAGIIWRKRRLRLAEAAAHRRGLEDTLAPFRETVKAALIHLAATDQSEGVVDAIRATADKTAEDTRELEEDEATARRALDLLSPPGKNAYEEAVACLRDDTREWWLEKLTWELDDYGEGETPYTADSDNLRRFLETELRNLYGTRHKELSNRPLIREQAFGEAFDPGKLERLARYEVHLDRKLERMLTMLIRLRDIRGGAVEP